MKSRASGEPSTNATTGRRSSKRSEISASSELRSHCQPLLGPSLQHQPNECPRERGTEKHQRGAHHLHSAIGSLQPLEHSDDGALPTVRFLRAVRLHRSNVAIAENRNTGLCPNAHPSCETRLSLAVPRQPDEGAYVFAN